MRLAAHVSIATSGRRRGSTPRAVLGAVALLSLSVAWAAQAGPPLESREQLIQRAQPAVGYSYWWGHGCWRLDGQDRGSCSGSCPGCSHSGSKGADCSGFVGKVWQVPNPSDVSQDSHPYSTWHFVNLSDHWIHKDRGACTKGDALVYNTDGAGHIVLVESGDPWGWVTAYEAKGCSYGIVHNSRTVGSSYACIERHNLGQAADASGCTAQQSQNCAAYGCHCVDGQCNGGYCDGGGCTAQQIQNCGAYGCNCVDGQCNGGFCDGSGCTAKETNDCAQFGCGCVDHQCNGAYCAGTGCTAKKTNDCSQFGCGCVDQQCNGVFCAGTGCTAKEANDCGQYGCNCVDHQCSGGFCDGSGCTVKETNDCAGFGVNCVDHQCSGGFGEGTGCTAKETNDCAQFGCSCVDHQCSGGFCEGTGCTARQTTDCDQQNQTCEAGACIAPSEYCLSEVAHSVCLPNGQLAHCTSQRVLDSAADCPSGQHCWQDACVVDACEPDCSTRACGPDPICGLACGACPANQVCDDAGQCRNGDCTADCLGRQCGLDPRCGQSCGDCPAGSSCTEDGTCTLDPESRRGILTGHVLLPQQENGDPGSPVEGSRVWLETGLESADFPDGRYRFVLDPGEYGVSAAYEGYEEGHATCRVEAGLETDCDIVLGPGDAAPTDPSKDGPGAGEDDSSDLVISGGCSSTGGHGGASALLFGLVLLLGRRRMI